MTDNEEVKNGEFDGDNKCPIYCDFCDWLCSWKECPIYQEQTGEKICTQ